MASNLKGLITPSPRRCTVHISVLRIGSGLPQLVDSRRTNSVKLRLLLMTSRLQQQESDISKTSVNVFGGNQTSVFSFLAVLLKPLATGVQLVVSNKCGERAPRGEHALIID